MTTRHLPTLAGHPQHAGGTLRRDGWWIEPLFTVAVLSGFIVYTTWAIFQASYYYAAPYLSPLYSPVLFAKLGAEGSIPVEYAWFGAWPRGWPDIPLLPASPALLILPFPGLFRVTCYYYRKAYYRSFGAAPPGCAVSPGERRRYWGETRLLVFQNLHRLALYVALGFLVVLIYDAILAFFKDGVFGVGLGSVVLTINAGLIGAYTFGCHSLRHLVGGRKDCLTCDGARTQYRAWRAASWFNARHALFAWASLLWVVLSDVYVRLVSMGLVRDPNTWE